MPDSPTVNSSTASERFFTRFTPQAAFYEMLARTGYQSMGRGAILLVNTPDCMPVYSSASALREQLTAVPKADLDCLKRYNPHTQMVCFVGDLVDRRINVHILPLVAAAPGCSATPTPSSPATVPSAPAVPVPTPKTPAGRAAKRVSHEDTLPPVPHFELNRTAAKRLSHTDPLPLPPPLPRVKQKRSAAKQESHKDTLPPVPHIVLKPTPARLARLALFHASNPTQR